MKKNTKVLLSLSIASLAIASASVATIVLSQNNFSNKLSDGKQISALREVSYDKEAKKIKFSKKWEQATYTTIAASLFSLVLVTTFFVVSRSLRKIRENEYENVKTIELDINSNKKT